MGKILFWLLWVAELVLFVALGGCVVLLLGAGGVGNMQVGLFFIFAVTAIAMLAGLFLAYKAMQRGARPGQLVLYLAIPLIAAFVGFSGCLLVIN